VTLDTGEKVSIAQKVNVSVKSENAFLAWLDEHGYTDAGKAIIELSRGEEVEEAYEWLAKNGYSFKHKMNVHPATRVKIMKERIEAGEELPDSEVASVSVFEIANIKEQ
jgi:hypothetical protein